MKRYELAEVIDEHRGDMFALYTIDRIPASEIPDGAFVREVINSDIARTIIFRSKDQAPEDIGQVFDAQRYSVVRTGIYMTVDRFMGTDTIMRSAFGINVKAVNQTLHTFAGAANFINATAQPGVFYKWTKTETHTDPDVTVTSVGTFVVMDDFPVRSIYALCTDRNPNPTVSGISKKDYDEYINMLVGATITNAVLKSI